MKKFSIYCGYDIEVWGNEEPREVELEVNFLSVGKTMKFSGMCDALDTTSLDTCLEEESDDFVDFLERTHEELIIIGDNIEYSYNDSKEGEINFYLSAFFTPRYDRLLVLHEDGKEEEYGFAFEEIPGENLIHNKKWNIVEIKRNADKY